jgi:hypothetical protein
VTIRYNTINDEGAQCFTLDLSAAKPILVDPTIDLAAVLVKGDIPGFIPYVFTKKNIADDSPYYQPYLKEGAEVYTIGYLLGAPGITVNIPISRYGALARVSGEKWFSQPGTGVLQRGWIAEINATPGLSGSPVMARSVQLGLAPDGQPTILRIMPTIIGVVKATMGSVLGPQGVAVIEPYDAVQALVAAIEAHIGTLNMKIVD